LCLVPVITSEQEECIDWVQRMIIKKNRSRILEIEETRLATVGRFIMINNTPQTAAAD
jgi:hypothetical protein